MNWVIRIVAPAGCDTDKLSTGRWVLVHRSGPDGVCVDLQPTLLWNEPKEALERWAETLQAVGVNAVVAPRWP